MPHAEILSLGYFTLLDSKLQKIQTTDVLTVYSHYNLLVQWLEVCCFTLEIPSSQACWLTGSYWIVSSGSNWFLYFIYIDFESIFQVFCTKKPTTAAREHGLDARLPYLSTFISFIENKLM